jgi:hypothetical protein
LKSDRLLEVDDVDAVAGSENVGFHLGVPLVGLMTEVDPRLKQRLHGNIGHTSTPFSFFPPPPSTRPGTSPPGEATPVDPGMCEMRAGADNIKILNNQAQIWGFFRNLQV